MEEKKVGEVFEFEGAVLQSIEVGTKDMNCGECYFNLNNNCNDDVHCLPCERLDGKNVIFKEINKTMPTREEVGKMLPIIKAYAEGKTIQFRAHADDEWRDVKELALNGSPITGEYRIKPEPKYRPFKTQEECWNEMLNHHPFGSLKSKDNDYFCLVGSVNKNVTITLAIEPGTDYSCNYLFEHYIFPDGTPFGITEE